MKTYIYATIIWQYYMGNVMMSKSNDVNVYQMINQAWRGRMYVYLGRILCWNWELYVEIIGH